MRRNCAACSAGFDVVVSALGASVSPASKEQRSYFAVDTLANRNLLAEAKREGVRRFIYVAVHVEPGCARTSYIRAHEKFVENLRASGISHTVVRPTGVFTAFGEMLGMARRMPLPVVGGGGALTNPIHPEDVAELCLACLSEGPADLSCGGPETFSRREISRMIFRAMRRRPLLLPAPAWMLHWAGRLARIANPRMAELLEFVAAVAVTDCVAPARGERRLEEYLDAVAASRRSLTY